MNRDKTLLRKAIQPRRNAFHAQVKGGDEEAIKRGWQKDYFQGRDPGKERFENHQTELGVLPFEDVGR